MTTPDNTDLSEVLSEKQSQLRSSVFEVNFTPALLEQSGPANESVRQFLEASRTPNTLRAYRSDLAQFLAYGGRVPCDPSVVAGYLAQTGPGLATATLRRRLVAIGQAHTNVGLPDPCKSDLVRLTLRGILRLHGRPQSQAKPVSKHQLEKIVFGLGRSLRDHRDRALLLVGFFGAFRRSELVNMDVKSVSLVAEGFSIFIPKSKADQERRGRRVTILRRSDSICPVEALQEWISTSGIGYGPIFRSVSHHEEIGEGALSPETINVTLKKRLSRMGVTDVGYSGHSLRAGFVTEAVNAGWPLWKIRQQTGHANDTMLQRYIRHDQVLAEQFSSI